MDCIEIRLKIFYSEINSSTFGMKSYRVALVEDNPDDQQTLVDFVARSPFLTLVGSFDEPFVALPFLTTQPVDLLLLDLNLPGLSGFGLLRSLPNPPAVILTTSSLADSLEAFDAGVVDYLVKPIRYERFLRAVNRVLARQANLPAPVLSPTIVLRNGYESVRVMLEHVTHIQASGAYARVYLTGHRTLMVNHSLTELVEQLPAAQFVRVHRSFIVAIAQVSTFSNRQLLINNQPIPVGRAYADDLLHLLAGTQKS